MAKTEYKTVTITASGGAVKFSAEKFDADCTEKINAAASELSSDGWELFNVFSVAVAGIYTLVFKRDK